MKFKAPIEVQAGISDGDPTNPLGLAGYLLSSDGSNVSWVSPGGLSAKTAEAVVQPIKANEALTKGDPLYIVGFQNGQDVNIVEKADSSDPAKMPVVGIADADYNNQAFGTMTAFGSFNGNFDTTGGTENWSIGDIIFVKPGGGLTNIKPGGTDLIQNIAVVSRVNSQTGELEVIALGRTNDVPNLPTGRLFVGTATNTSLTSDVVYIDDANDRVGIGTTSPGQPLHVNGNARVDGDFFIIESNPQIFLSDTNHNSDFSINLNSGLFKITDTTNSADRITLDSSGNVGIGTTSPSTNLEVSPSNNLNGVDISVSTNASQSGALFFTTGDAAEGFMFRNSNGTLGINYGAIPNSSSGATKVSINGSTGNVGIGTTSPGSKLHVVGGTRLTQNGQTLDLVGTDHSYIGFYPDGTSAGRKAYIGFGSATSDRLTISNEFNDDISFFTNGSEKVTIENSGDVGIGTTSPAQKLHVYNGTAYVTPISYAANQSAYALKVGAYNNTAFDMGLQAKSTSGGSPYMSFETSNTDDVLTMWGGSVGVGALPDPSYKLDVNGTARLVSDMYLGRYIFHDGDTNTWLGFPLADTISFRTNGSDRMYINSSGNVGIGTTNPSYKLDVAGDLRVDNGDLGSISGDEVTHAKIHGGRHFLEFKEVRTANDTDWRNTTYKLQAGVDTTNHQSIDFVSDGSYQEHIDIKTGNQLFNTRFTSDGNVGIGTTSPAKKLTIGSIGIGNTDGLKIEDPSNTAYGAHYSYDDGSTTVEIGGVVNNALRDCISIARDATRTITIDTSERVGIGTTTPRTKLHVLGQTSSMPTLGAAPSAAQLGGPTYGTLFSTLTTGRGVIQQGRSDGVALSFDLLLQPVGGNVGIGATSSSSKLYIEGSTSTTSSQLMRIKSTTSFGTTPGRIIEFIRSNSTVRGYISMNQYGVQYNTSSDYRLKENITPINDALDRLKKLKPNRFSWKEGPSDYKVDGFIAHEVAEVIPEAISGEKDAVDENNKPSYQGIDQAKIVPLLTAALQEAVTKIEQLETRIQTLENK